MTTDNIKAISIDDEGKLRIYPSSTTYDNIHKSVAEVHWDAEDKFLYSPSPRDSSYLQWFIYIVFMINSKCGNLLIIDGKTEWMGFPEETKNQITLWAEKSGLTGQFSQSLINKITYWFISAFVIIFIFIVFFGILPPLLMESKNNLTTVISLTLGASGTFMILFSLYAPRRVSNILIRKPGSLNLNIRDHFGSLVFGFSSLLGGILYARMYDVKIILISFGIGIIIVQARLAYLRYKYNTNK